MEKDFAKVEKNNNANGRNTQGDVSVKFLMSQFVVTCLNFDELCVVSCYKVKTSCEMV